MFFVAFLPQFIDPAQPVSAQFAVLGALFLVLEVVAIAAYAWMGVHLRRWFSAPRGRRIFNRASAGAYLDFHSASIAAGSPAAT